MADIFLSYAREDRQKAESIARVLRDAGWSVWWDRSILPGSSFEQVIEHEYLGGPLRRGAVVGRGATLQLGARRGDACAEQKRARVGAQR